MKYVLQLLLCFHLNPLVAQTCFVLKNLPQDTPKDAKIYLASAASRWQPNAPDFEFSKIKEELYVLNLERVNYPFQFKLTLGSWQSVEVDAQGKDIDNRLVMRAKDTVYMEVAAWKSGENTPISTANSNVKILEKTFIIDSLERERKVWLYLPPNYENSRQRYPVIYMHDGQNLFDNKTAYSEEWGVDELLNAHFAQTRQGFIVVGIENAGEFRLEEYQPWQHPEYGKGSGKVYTDFIVNQVKPYIDANFRSLPEAENTAIWGSSMGGLISFYACLKYPEVFGKAGIFSPSFWIAEPYLKPFIEGFEGKTPPKMYLLSGLGESPLIYEKTRKVSVYLSENGFSRLRLIEKAEGKHTESFWRREFIPALQYLFPAD